MSAPAARPPRTRRSLTTALLLVPLLVLGLLSSLPFLLGPVLATLGVVLAWALRRGAESRAWGVEAVPIFAAVLILALASPAQKAPELFAGLSGLAALLWLADEPGVSGGWIRAVPTLGLAALGFGLAWALALALPSGTQSVGAAGVLLVAALVLVAVVLFVVVLRPRPETA